MCRRGGCRARRVFAGFRATASVSLDLGRLPAGRPGGVSNGHISEAYEFRVSTAGEDALLGTAVNVDNGDPALYADKAGAFVIPNPVVSSSDGLSLVPYTGADAGQLTVNAELNKLAHNVSFGHGVHAGIHGRSDTDTSLLLGEAVALSFLRDKARTYNEPFTVNLTRFDGTIATVSNAGHA
jgi:hypothetical protein